MKADILSLDAKKNGTVELNDAVYGLEPRADLLHRMVTYQLAKRQAGTHKTKNRSEIAGTTKKFGRQKGGGGARHGNRKSNIFVGGGKAHGPVVRSHAINMPKKVRALALKTALSSKAKSGQLIVLENTEVKDGKTKALRTNFAKLGIQSALIVDGAEVNENFARAARNIERVDVLPAQGINVYDILRRDHLVLTTAAVESLEERFK
ncbi:MAG: 50S ribosomal protein L4 [Parvibaculales bacterium]